jgi:xanthine/uracil permease
VLVVAGVFANLLGLSSKFGAVVLTIPGPVIGGPSLVVYGMITATAGRIWVENRVDFSVAGNLFTLAVVLIAGWRFRFARHWHRDIWLDHSLPGARTQGAAGGCQRG